MGMVLPGGVFSVATVRVREPVVTGSTLKISTFTGLEDRRNLLLGHGHLPQWAMGQVEPQSAILWTNCQPLQRPPSVRITCCMPATGARHTPA